MQPPQANLAPPKDDPFTVEQLKQYDGSDPSKPIYVAIKGTVFDVTRKADTYGKGKSYNLFAGKDASRALGMSSLKEEDAVSDYSTLSEADTKTLNDWYDFFSKRYNIVGKVVDLPPQGNHSQSASNPAPASASAL
ncbi:progesterone binding protein [Pilatotrama ljubarskyi]|nr:progesterone binding protein [Pilatotrama ljubarskyi]